MKKKRCRNWNGLGYCPTVSQYNGKLYWDTAGFRCDGGWKLYCNIGQLGVQWVQLYCNMGEVYCNRGWLGWGKLCHNTRNCIVTRGLLAELCHDTTDCIVT